MYVFSASTHTNIWNTESIVMFWACTRFEAQNAGSKQNRFSYVMQLAATFQHLALFSILKFVNAHINYLDRLVQTRNCPRKSGWRHCWVSECVHVAESFNVRIIGQHGRHSHEYIHMMYSFKLGMLAYIIILENEFASDPRGPWQSKLDFVQDQVRTNIFVPIKSSLLTNLYCKAWVVI